MSSGFSVTIATHHGLPDGAPDDVLLAQCFEARGIAVRFAVWNDPNVGWDETPLTIVRSTWDYHHSVDKWLGWVDATAKLTHLVNPADVLRWNTDKRYLLRLERAGVACVPTLFVDSSRPIDFDSALAKHGWSDIVVKPAVGASASGVRRFTAAVNWAHARQHLAFLSTSGSVLIQPFIPEVETERERSLVFIEGQLSHAFTKPAFNTNASGSSDFRRYEPDLLEVAVALAAIEEAPTIPIYARVDLVITQNKPQVMELEVIEPDLGLRLCPAAADRLVDACLNQRSESKRRRQ